MNERIAGEAQSTSRVVERPAWSPAQVFGVAGGVVLVVIGAIALARTGTHFYNIPATHAMAVGSSFTCLSAIVQLGVGVLLLGACVFPMSAKSAIGHFWCAPCGLGNRHRRRHPKTLPHVGLHQGHRLLSISSSVLYGGFRAAALSPIFFPSRREVSRASSATVDSTASMT